MEAMYLKNANLPLLFLKRHLFKQPPTYSSTKQQITANPFFRHRIRRRKPFVQRTETKDIFPDGAVEYLKKQTSSKKDTDAIYLIVTKTDMTGRTGTDLQEALREYVYRHYKNFYNGLNGICRINGINGGKVVCMPFSVGKVCFKVYCKFDDRAAANVVRELLTRCKGFKTGKYQDILNRFKR